MLMGEISGENNKAELKMPIEKTTGYNSFEKFR